SLVSLIVALSGSALGALGGSLVPLLLGPAAAALGANFLPAEVLLRPSLGAIGHGMAAGTLSTLAFTLVPIWRTSAVAPLRVFGRSSDALAPLGAARNVRAFGLGAALLS